MKDIEERIFTATRNLLVKHGYVATTTRRIAEVARVNEVTLFRRYLSKENLVKSVIEEAEKNALEALDSILLIDTEVDLRSNLQTIGHSLLRFNKDQNDLMILQITGSQLPDDQQDLSVAKQLASIPQKVVNHLSEYFDEMIRDGVLKPIDPRNAALIFMSYISYCHLTGVILNNEFSKDCKAGFDDFLDVFTGGILKT